MNKLFVCFFVAMFLCQNLNTIVQAQNNFRIESFEAWQPDYIKENNGASSGIQQKQSWQEWCEARIKRGDLGENSQIVWLAYSDRNNNYTYCDPSYNNKTSNKLNFGDRVYIAKIQNGFALVFTDNIVYEFSRGPRSKAKFLGWIPIENLLLWEECPKNKSQIYEKALVVLDPTSTSVQKNKALRRNPPYILNPSNENDTSKMLFARDLDILFVMKKTVISGKTYYLLSNQVNMGSAVKSSLLGWLPVEYITEWNQRLVLEPTIDKDAISKYSRKGLKPAAFTRYADAEKYYGDADSSIMNQAIYKYDNFVTKRMDPLIIRHPIVSSTKNAHIFKVAVMSSMGENATGFANSKAQYQREIEELTKKQQNINVIFVIDATSSMKEFYGAISNALKDLMERDFFSNPSTKSYIRVGAVLYRDYKDHAENGPELKPLTRNVNELIGFLKNVKACSKDADEWEAMYDGLEAALNTKKMGYTEDQSNFIILIGDAGNHKEWKGQSTTQKIDELADKMYANNINFLAYQVNNPGKDEYAEFSIQVSKMQKKLTDKYQTKSKAQMKYKNFPGGIKKMVRDDDQDDLPIYIMKKTLDPGESVSAQELTGQVEDKIKNFYDLIANKLELLQQMSEGGYRISGKSEEKRIREALRMADWSEDRITSVLQYMKSGGVAKFIAFAPENLDGTKLKAYEYVLFFTDKELANMIHELGKVNKSGVNGAKAYQEAIVSMGKKMLGDFSETELGKMDLGEMMAMIYGVPIKIRTLGGEIRDIINKSPEELEQLIADFSEKLERLSEIRANHECMFSKNGQSYYWVPLSVVPGFKISVDY